MTFHLLLYKTLNHLFVSLYRLSNRVGLEAAVEAASEFLNKAVKPVMVGGPELQVAKAGDAFVELADASGYATSVLPAAKGLVPENHPCFIGTYWGVASTSFCSEIVESADAYLFAGPIFDDITSVGNSLFLNRKKSIIVKPDSVIIGNKHEFGSVLMKDFLKALGRRLKRNVTAYENYHRISVPEGKPPKCVPNEPLRVNVMFQHIQKMLSTQTAVVVDCGDSWFNCVKLKLPPGCR